MGTGDLLGQIVFPAARPAGKSPVALEGEKSNIERKREGPSPSSGSLENPLDQSRFDDDADDADDGEIGKSQSHATTMPMTAAQHARPSPPSKLKKKKKVDFKSIVKFVSVGGWFRDLCLLPVPRLYIYIYNYNVVYLISLSSLSSSRFHIHCPSWSLSLPLPCHDETVT